MGNAKLKICVGYHKPSFLLKGDCFVPMWGGKAVAGQASKDGAGLSAEEQRWMNEHCIGDDSGDNISDKNRNYCEATYLYWMWKNYKKLGNPEYIGFLQYRAHWILKKEYVDSRPVNKFYNMIGNKCFSEDYQYRIGLTESALENILKDSDVVICESDMGKTVQQYKEAHFSQDIRWWQDCIDIVNKDWPQYASYVNCYNNQNKYVWKNCFIMKREDFLEYCDFLFDVLAKIDKCAKPEYKNMTTEQMRVPAYVSETLLGAYVLYLKDKKRRITNIPLMVVEKPFDSLCSLPQYIEPVFKKAVPVVFIADENYVKYTAVAIESLIQNASEKNNYDVIILHDGRIKNETQQRIEKMQTKNVSIRFFNAQYYIQKYNFAEFFHRRLNTMPYLKLFIHEILHDYDKAIFLDGDMLILNDIAKLYNESLNGKLIGAVNDYVMTKTKDSFWNFRRNYVISNNKMNNIDNYFNSGMLLFDLNKMRNTPELINRFINEARFKHPDRLHHDQDVFNFVLENDVKKLSHKYNFQTCLLSISSISQNIPAEIKQEMQQLIKNFDDIVVAHYDGDKKPWQITADDWFSNIWWKYARQTPFYEEFLQKIFSKNVCSYKYIDVGRIKRKYHTHRLLSHITFGKLARKQKERMLNYRHKLEDM